MNTYSATCLDESLLDCYSLVHSFACLHLYYNSLYSFATCVHPQPHIARCLQDCLCVATCPHIPLWICIYKPPHIALLHVSTCTHLHLHVATFTCTYTSLHVYIPPHVCCMFSLLHCSTFVSVQPHVTCLPFYTCSCSYHLFNETLISLSPSYTLLPLITWHKAASSLSTSPLKGSLSCMLPSWPYHAKSIQYIL